MNERVKELASHCVEWPWDQSNVAELARAIVDQELAMDCLDNRIKAQEKRIEELEQAKTAPVQFVSGATGKVGRLYHAPGFGNVFFADEDVEALKEGKRFPAPSQPTALKSVEELAMSILVVAPCRPCMEDGIRRARAEIKELCERMMEKRAPGDWHDGFEVCCKVLIAELDRVEGKP